MFILRFLLAFFCLIINFFPLHAKDTAFRNFWHPTYQGERLNYCSLDGRICGKAIADKYCKLLGYTNSTQNVIAYNVGLTNFLASRARCKGWQCNGFMTITCADITTNKLAQKHHYREQYFAYPRYNEYRIDWCYSQGQGCGAKAAHSFCSRMGFMRAKKFVKEQPINATKHIGTNQLCFGDQCAGFQSILCFR